MRRPHAPFRLVAAMVATVVAAACGSSPAAPAEAAHDGPAHVEPVAGQEGLHRITLTEEASARLGIEIAEVAAAPGGGARTRVPFSAVIYDADGAAWAYIVDGAPNIFVRHPLTVEDVVPDAAGDYAVLTAGPSVGMSVVSVGVAELFGAEFEVGH